MMSRGHQRLAAAILGALVFLVFSECLSFGFVWDDEHFILRNTYLTSWKYLPNLLMENVDAGAGVRSNPYRPLEMLTHFLDVRVWGYQAWAHHLTTVLIHAATTVVIFRWLSRFAPWSGAFVAALAYGLHPLQSVAVPYIPGRVDDLAILSLCLGLLAFERSVAVSLCCAVLAMLSKESMVLFPVFLWLHQQASGQPASWKRLWPFCAVAFVYVLLRLTVLNFHNTLNFYGQDNILTQHPSYRLWTYLTTLPEGLRLWIWPSDIHHERSWAVYSSLTIPRVWLSLLGVAAWVGVALWQWRRRRVLAVGLLWCLVATLPTSNLIVLINALFYDHWFLLPGLGLAMAASQIPALQRLSARQTWCVALGITVGLGAVTWQSNRVWRDPVSLNTHLRRFEPHHPKILHNLAMALADQGNLEESIRLYQQAIAESDVYPHTHHNLARAYERLGRLDEAAEEYRKALAIDGAFHHSALALGQLELARGRDEAAEQMFRSALASYPYTAEAYLGLSQLALKRGDRAGARTALERGLRIVDDARLREALKELHPHDPRR
ncbi:MAG TPA: hypothetical protein DDX89_09045 [Candidatus Omnitrophica bacterium]|nr:hypothetical protein [Candidatus Omnitrophota bacterium]HBQ38394.1 hypothetical protein [Candidatus Omnitrophota bacterium]